MLYYFFQLCLMKMFQHRESECCCFHVCVSYRINSRYCLAIFALPLYCFSPESFECKLQIQTQVRELSRTSHPVSQAFGRVAQPEQLSQNTMPFQRLSNCGCWHSYRPKSSISGVYVEEPLGIPPGQTGLQRFWFHQMLPVGQAIRPGN